MVEKKNKKNKSCFGFYLFGIIGIIMIFGGYIKDPNLSNPVIIYGTISMLFALISDNTSKIEKQQNG